MIVMFALLVLTTLAAAIIFTTQTEVQTTGNYKLVTQARYVAEAGVQSTLDWLGNGGYTAPTSFGSYDSTKSPVQYSTNPVVLSAVSGVSSNYPDSTVQTAFNTALHAQSVSGISGASYSTYATLIRQTPSSTVSWLSGTGGVVQTWQVTSQGTISGVHNDTLQVTATFERTGTPIFNYPIEVLASGCKATDGVAPVDFGGGTTSFTDSYNSNSGAYGGSNVQTSGGSIGSNGYVSLGASTNVEGIIADTNTTVGASCPTDGITVGSSAKYSGTKTLSSALTAPLPWGCLTTPCYPPGYLHSPTTQDVSTSCASISGCTTKSTTVINDGGHATTVGQYSLAPGTYGNLDIDSADVLYMSAGTYTVNSLNFAKDGQLVVTSGPVVVDVAGVGYTACTSANCSGTSVVVNAGGLAGWNLCSNGLPGNVGTLSQANCPTGPPVSGVPKTGAPISGIPGNFQMVYGGSAAIGTTGAPISTLIYAPNASVQMLGAPLALYGSAIVNSFVDTANSPFHYDNALANTALQVGPFTSVGGFSWSKY